MRLTEEEIINLLRETAEQYKPLVFKGIEEESAFIEALRADAVIEVSIENGPCFETVIEIVPVASPKIITWKISSLIDSVRELYRPDLVPVIIAPYIGQRQARILAQRNVCWIDLCGNMRVQVSGKTYIERTGNENRFPDTVAIKKIFQGTSSLVSRALLLKPGGFKTQYELVNFINNRNANITVSTVSKVLKSLEEELLITKTKSLFTTINKEELLEKLTRGYLDWAACSCPKVYRFAIEDNVERFLRNCRHSTVFNFPVEQYGLCCLRILRRKTQRFGDYRTGNNIYKRYRRSKKSIPTFPDQSYAGC